MFKKIVNFIKNWLWQKRLRNDLRYLRKAGLIVSGTYIHSKNKKWIEREKFDNACGYFNDNGIMRRMR